MIDERSQKNLDTLLPKVRPIFVQLLNNLQEHFAPKGVIPKYISGTRTFDEQAEIYAKGRTTPGPRVSNAKPGFSNHNYGIALDIGLFHDGKYLEDSPYYLEIGDVAAKFPQIEWGGSWKTIKDQPHVQYKVPYTLAEMRERVTAGRPIV
jgi:peptidoglycan L-alanyl-D-glutamate endopeptidase CwlK